MPDCTPAAAADRAAGVDVREATGRAVSLLFSGSPACIVAATFRHSCRRQGDRPRKHRLKAFRVILAIYMGWLLVCFAPGHTRGRITLPGFVDGSARPASAAVDTAADTAVDIATLSSMGSCCGPQPAPADDSNGDMPTPAQKRACAVCHWAAGLLPVAVFFLDLQLTERVFDRAVSADSQYVHLTLPRESLPRGPPVVC